MTPTIPPAARRCALALPVLAAVLATATTAASADAPFTPPADAAPSLVIQVTGSIAGRCELYGGGSLALGELEGGEDVSAGFGLDCNMPFDIDVQALKGGLTHATQPRGEGPFVGALPYRLSLTVPVLDPAPSTLRATFTSAELLAPRTVSSGDAIAAGGAVLRVRTDRPGGAGLLAGDYAETVTLTITPRV